MPNHKKDTIKNDPYNIMVRVIEENKILKKEIEKLKAKLTQYEGIPALVKICNEVKKADLSEIAKTESEFKVHTTLLDNVVIRPLHTVALFSKTKQPWVGSHYSHDSRSTVCGKKIDDNWEVLTNDYSGVADCKKCKEKQ